MEGNIVMRIILFADPGETELRLWGKCLAPSVSHVLRQQGCCPRLHAVLSVVTEERVMLAPR